MSFFGNLMPGGGGGGGGGNIFSKLPGIQHLRRVKGMVDQITGMDQQGGQGSVPEAGMPGASPVPVTPVPVSPVTSAPKPVDKPMAVAAENNREVSAEPMQVDRPENIPVGDGGFERPMSMRDISMRRRSKLKPLTRGTGRYSMN